MHTNNLRVNQGCPVPAKRVGLIKKIQIQNKQPHLGAKQGIAPADYAISNQKQQQHCRSSSLISRVRQASQVVLYKQNQLTTTASAYSSCDLVNAFPRRPKRRSGWPGNCVLPLRPVDGGPGLATNEGASLYWLPL